MKVMAKNGKAKGGTPFCELEMGVGAKNQNEVHPPIIISSHAKSTYLRIYVVTYYDNKCHGSSAKCNHIVVGSCQPNYHSSVLHIFQTCILQP